jgi:hypothetical protein
MGLWHVVNGWLIPKLPSLQRQEAPHPQHLLEFRLAGAFFALYMIVVGHPIGKISPHILVLLLCGSCPPDQEYMRAVDRHAASILDPWFEYVEHIKNGSTGIDRLMPSEVRDLLVRYLKVPVSHSSQYMI